MGDIAFICYAELGWEYLRWVGYCRRYALENPDNNFYVCTHSGREVMYEFCSGYVNHDFWFILKRNAGVDFGNMHGYGSDNFKNTNFDELERWTRRVLFSKFGSSGCEIIRHPLGIRRDIENSIQYMKFLNVDIDHEKMWNSLKSAHLEKFDSIIALFPRKRDDIRDWGEERYVELADILLENNYGVVIGGHRDFSFCTGLKTSYGLINLTELPSHYSLGLILAALNDCEAAIGSQSALPIIALGQGIPTLMFGCEKIRHTEYYNWACTDCEFIEDQEYCINPNDVFKQFKKFINKPLTSKNYYEVYDWIMVNNGDRLPNEKIKR